MLGNKVWRLKVCVLAMLSTLTVKSSPIEKLPKVGDEFNVPSDSDSVGLCMVSPGQMDSCLITSVDGVEYSIAYRKKSKVGKPIVTYIHTKDTKFVSPTRKRVGDSIEVSYAQLVPSPGFEIYAGKRVGIWSTVVGFNGKVVSNSGDLVDIETLRKESSPVRLRISGFTAR